MDQRNTNTTSVAFSPCPPSTPPPSTTPQHLTNSNVRSATPRDGGGNTGEKRVGSHHHIPLVEAVDVTNTPLAEPSSSSSGLRNFRSRSFKNTTTPMQSIVDEDASPRPYQSTPQTPPPQPSQSKQHTISIRDVSGITRSATALTNNDDDNDQDNCCGEDVTPQHPTTTTTTTNVTYSSSSVRRSGGASRVLITPGVEEDGDTSSQYTEVKEQSGVLQEDEDEGEGATTKEEQQGEVPQEQQQQQAQQGPPGIVSWILSWIPMPFCCGNNRKPNTTTTTTSSNAQNDGKTYSYEKVGRRGSSTLQPQRRHTSTDSTDSSVVSARM